MKYLPDKIKYLFQVSFGGLIFGAFSFNALSYSGEIQEVADHFSGYIGSYFALFLLWYFLVSLAYLLFFIHKAGVEQKRAIKVEGPIHIVSILLLPYLINYQYIFVRVGLAFFYFFLFAVFSLRIILLVRYFTANKSRREVGRFSILLGIVFFGTILRLLLLFTSQGIVGSEEAIMGLMARHMLLQGESYVFLWGQPYMGSLEALLAVPIFFLFGASSLTLKVIPLVFSILFIISSYFLVRLTLGEDAALISALLISISPVFLTVFSMLANAYIENLFYGSIVLILSYLIAYQSGGRKQLYFFLLLGFVAGIAFWNNLTSIIYIATAFLFLALEWRRWYLRILPKILAFFGGLIFGSLPLWLFNLKHQWVTFKVLTEGLSTATPLYNKVEQTLVNFGNLFGVARAIVGGGQNVITDLVVYALYALSFLYALYYFVSKKNAEKSEKGGLKLFLLLTLMLALFFSISRYGSLNEARYALALYLALPVFLALFLRDVRKRSLAFAVILLLIVLFSNILGNIKDTRIVPPQPELIANFLSSKNISYVYTNFWTAYQLTFASKEKVVSYAISGPNVFPPYIEKVREADFRETAVIFNKDESFEQFERKLVRGSVEFRKENLAGKAIFYSFSKKIELSLIPSP